MAIFDGFISQKHPKAIHAILGWPASEGPPRPSRWSSRSSLNKPSLAGSPLVVGWNMGCGSDWDLIGMTYDEWPGWWWFFYHDGKMILKNMTWVRQWEGWHPIDEMENNPVMFETTKQWWNDLQKFESWEVWEVLCIYSQGSPSAVWAWWISWRRTENQRLTHMRRVGLGTPSLSVGTSVSYSWTSKHIGPRLEWCMVPCMVNDGLPGICCITFCGKRDDPSTGFGKSYTWVVIQCHPPN